MIRQRLFIFYIVVLLSGILYSPGGFSQPAPPAPTCSICGGKNGVHLPSCRYYNPPAGRSKPQGTSMPGNIQQLNMLIDMFNTPTGNKEAEARKEIAKKEALEAKQRDEILRKERHEREMKTFKPLDDDPNVVHFDTQPGSGTGLKPLPPGNAPMTMEERERANLLKHSASVTWNYNEFSNISSDDAIPSPRPEPELTENEKLVNDVIGNVESNGGRLAAITGRYILNVKDGVMSYLDDATYAVTSGNSYLMKEVGEFDVRKITINAIYKTASQTVRAYYDNAKDAVTGALKDESIGIMTNAAVNKLEEYKYFDNLSKAWKQTH
jgi:hypothetical protein